MAHHLEVLEIATRLGTVFPDFELEVFDDRHHFDPPHRIEPARLATSLRQRVEPRRTRIVDAALSSPFRSWSR